MKHIFSIILFLNSLSLLGQALVVSDEMKLMPTNIYAAHNQMHDKDGLICSVLIIHCTTENLDFLGDGIVNISQTGSDYFLHLSPKTNYIELKYNHNESLKLSLSQIESKRTYEMTVSEKDRYGYLKLETIPTGCKIDAYVNGEIIPLGYSPIRKPIELKEGEYKINISKKNFLSKTLDIEIIYDNVTEIRNINLKPK